MSVVIAPMQLADLPAVMEIDQLSFPHPWSVESYHYELTQNPTAHFWVAVAAAPPEARRVVGYAGVWLIVDEAHINTLAVHPDWRQQGIGEQLLATLLQHARAHGARTATLEVRASNRAAQQLYRRHGFVEVGRRKNYYSASREDALLLTAQL